MRKRTPSREELFALVWDRSARDVAKDLGISDVALGKLCKQLQVPKPPRGYWAKVAAGRKPRVPPLQAFKEANAILSPSAKKHRRHAPQLRPLSEPQWAFLDKVMSELRGQGAEVNEYPIGYDGIRKMDPTLAAQALILIQNCFEVWLKEGLPIAMSDRGARQSVRSLVGKLLPVAREQVVVFERCDEEGKTERYGPRLFVRMSAVLQQRIARNVQLACEERLSQVYWDLGWWDSAFEVDSVGWPSQSDRHRYEFCVSRNEAWLRAERRRSWDVERFETCRCPIRDVVPIELIPDRDIQLPPYLGRSTLKPYDRRLKALREAEAVLETLLDATRDFEANASDEHLALIDQIWFGQAPGPLGTARRSWRKLEDELEAWERAMNAERTALCREILGLQIGDTVVAVQGGKTVRVRVEYLTLSASDGRMFFILTGKRYRKDGLPGKRYDTLYIDIDRDPRDG